MVAVASRLFPPGPALREVYFTFALSVLFHAVLTVAVVMVPRFQVGTYIKIPVSYTVSLVDAPPGGGRGGAPAAAPRSAPAASSRVPEAVLRPPAVRAAPAPRAAPTEELTLPSKPVARKPAPPAKESPVRPPAASTKEATRSAPPLPVPMAPAAPGAPIAPVVPAVPTPLPPAPVPVVPAVPTPLPPAPVPVVPAVPTPLPPVVSGTSGAAKTSGVEVAGTGSGAGTGDTGIGGGSAIASYLTLVDWKIQQNWIPTGASGAEESAVVIRFRVLRSGQVRDLELETSSGNAGLDASALRAIRQSLPLPPFPNLLTEPSLDLRYRFVMERG